MARTVAKRDDHSGGAVSAALVVGASAGGLDAFIDLIGDPARAVIDNDATLPHPAKRASKRRRIDKKEAQ
jgi:hypothetical protein